METLLLLPFEDGRITGVEQFDSSKYDVKEIRVKDLHKFLSGKPSMRVRLVREAADFSSAAERGEGEQNAVRGRSGYRLNATANTDSGSSERGLAGPKSKRSANRGPDDSFEVPTAINKVDHSKLQDVHTVKHPEESPDVEHTQGHENRDPSTKGAAARDREGTDLSSKRGAAQRHEEVGPSSKGGPARLKLKHSPSPARPKASSEGRCAGRDDEPSFSLPTASSGEEPCPEEDTESESLEHRNRPQQSGLKWSHNFPDVFTENSCIAKKSKSLGSKPHGDDVYPGRKKVASTGPKSKTPGSVSTKRKTPGSDGMQSRTPLRKLRSCFNSEDPSSEAEKHVHRVETEYPSFKREMKHSNVKTCFWLSVPPWFGKIHLPSTDEVVVLEDEKGVNWEANYLVRKSGLSGGWRRFSMDHNLEEGDIVEFELVKPLKFKVYITRLSKECGAIVPVDVPRKESRRKAREPKEGRRKSMPIPKPSSRVTDCDHDNKIPAPSAGKKRKNKERHEDNFPRKKPSLAGLGGHSHKVEDGEDAQKGFFHGQGDHQEDPTVRFVNGKEPREDPPVKQVNVSEREKSSFHRKEIEKVMAIPAEDEVKIISDGDEEVKIISEEDAVKAISMSKPKKRGPNVEKPEKGGSNVGKRKQRFKIRARRDRSDEVTHVVRIEPEATSNGYIPPRRDRSKETRFVRIEPEATSDGYIPVSDGYIPPTPISERAPHRFFSPDM